MIYNNYITVVSYCMTVENIFWASKAWKNELEAFYQSFVFNQYIISPKSKVKEPLTDIFDENEFLYNWNLKVVDPRKLDLWQK